MFRKARQGVLLTFVLLATFYFMRHWFEDENNKHIIVTNKEVRVPNIVHFFLFKEVGNQQDEDKIENEEEQKVNISFIGATCILAVYFNQKPDEILIHTNWEHRISGRYLDLLKKLIGDNLKLVHLQRPTHVYGNLLSSAYHSTDVARIKTLISEGGIALDFDTFVIKPLNEFFDNEVTIGWPRNQNIGTQASET